MTLHEEDEEEDKEVEVHEPNLTVSLTQKQMELMKKASTTPEHEEKVQTKKDIIIQAPAKDKNSSVPTNTTSVAAKKVPKPILDMATNKSEKLPVNNLTWVPDKEEVPPM